MPRTWLPVTERLAISEPGTDEEACSGTIQHRVEFDHDYIAGLKGIRPPAISEKTIGSAALDTPLLLCAVFIFNVNLYPDMRVGPLKFSDRCRFLTHHGLIKHSAGMVRQYYSGCRHQTDKTRNQNNRNCRATHSQETAHFSFPDPYQGQYQSYFLLYPALVSDRRW